MIVSVVMITYCHENYIRQAIEGVLAQKCNFDIELIVANDNSPDNSDKIIVDIIATHPNGKWIKYQKHERNLGPSNNSFWAFSQARGKYVAICEGDDYWIDPEKLQRQVNFLEANVEYNLTAGHNMRLVDGNLVFDNIYDNQDSSITRFDYIRKRSFHISTACFRNTILFPNWLLGVYSCDKFIIFLGAGSKKIYVENKVLSVYRVHKMGISSLKVAKEIKRKRLQGNIRGLNMIKDDFLGHDLEWIMCQLKYLSLIEGNMDASIIQKFFIILLNLPFLIRKRNMLNHRMILGFFFK